MGAFQHSNKRKKMVVMMKEKEIPTIAQYKFMKAILSNRELFVRTKPALTEDAFEDAGMKRIVKVINQFYNEKGQIPTMMDIQLKLRMCDKDNLDGMREAKAAYQEIMKQNSDGMETAYEEIHKYLQQQATVDIFKKAANAVKYEYTKEKVEDAITKIRALDDVKVDECVVPFEKMEDMMSEPPSEKIPTYIREIDEASFGGLFKGTVGLLIAGTGVGKTTFFAVLAITAAMNDKKVLHIYFEDRPTDMMRKYCSTITGRDTNYYFGLEGDARKQAIAEIYKEKNAKKAFKENIRSICMPNGTTQVCDIENLIRRLELAEGWKPDVVFIDYLSCLQSSSDKRIALQQEHTTWESVMKKIEALAHRENIAIWIAQQTNRDGEKEDTGSRGMSVIQGSYRATQPASMILYLNKLNTNYRDEANIHLEKCRWGKPTNWDNIMFNNATCQIDLSKNAYDPLEFMDNDNSQFIADIS